MVVCVGAVLRGAEAWLGTLLHGLALLGLAGRRLRGAEGGQERAPLHRDSHRRDQAPQVGGLACLSFNFDTVNV